MMNHTFQSNEVVQTSPAGDGHSATRTLRPQNNKTVGAHTDHRIRQSVYYVSHDKKRQLLRYILADRGVNKAVVFAKTKHRAELLAKDLNRSGISAEAFHGDTSTCAQERSLANFKQQRTRILVATDAAASNIELQDLPMVINFELPDSAQTYTDRIGRAQADGSSRHALSFCDREEKGYLKNIHRELDRCLDVVSHPFEH